MSTIENVFEFQRMVGLKIEIFGEGPEYNTYLDRLNKVFEAIRTSLGKTKKGMARLSITFRMETQLSPIVQKLFDELRQWAKKNGFCLW